MFRLIDWDKRQYIRGNFIAFGVWQGLIANITLMSPLLNTLINWKHRNKTLVFVDMETGKEYDKIQTDGICRIVNKDDL